MTVDLCTKSCKEIGQPLAALNYGTVSHSLGSTLCILTASVHADPAGMAVYNYPLSPAVNPALETVLNGVEGGQVNLVSTARTWVIVLSNLRVISVVGRRPPRKLSKASGSGWMAKVWIAAARSAPPRTLFCPDYRMANVGRLLSFTDFANE
jgi:hypothetical protein